MKSSADNEFVVSAGHFKGVTMDAVPGWAANSEGSETGQVESLYEEAWLMGQPPLYSYLDHMKQAVGSSAITPSALVNEWRDANDYYYDLETTEVGLADQIEIFELPSALGSLANEITEDASFRRAFDTLPTRLAMVELKHLVTHQRHIDLTHIKRLRLRLSPSPTLEELFRFCLPLHRSDVKVDMRRLGKNRYMLWSESSDIRFQEAVMLRPWQVVEHDAKGPVGGVIGLMVGLGSNFLCGIQSEKRLLLHNGYHRAYSLLEHGVTHAPCIIETVTRLDELYLVAGSRVQDAPAFYFKAKRPPLLKDFLDPRICKVIRVPRTVHCIDINVNVQEYSIPG